MNLPDPFSLCVALMPLAGYLLLIGGLRLSGRPFVTTSAREAASLGIAVAGFAAIGPAQLFFPSAAGALFGWRVWFMLAAFYALCVALVSLTTRPRICIHGLLIDEAFPAVCRAARTMDADVQTDARGFQIFFPHHGFRFRLDSHPGVDHVSVIAFEPNVTVGFWFQFLKAIRGEVAQTPVVAGSRGVAMVVAAVLILGFLLYQAVPNQELLVEGFRHFLYRE
ncbi:hypothetical protein [Crateriforma conspicua]|uniref:Uncharacterized protein n=1 Tax=Crateriforma conspicua TaxID=2527996 RepID=A0A5C5Y2S6_9PLAN|nr:hypothetical protein [Crateriforma conspicua]QDV63915.1 hypothetical protein Mal65_30620 [Crateriforma conspicua]TWT69278.1 hypothetical protein Pan14r_15630 [Crateriforma conspicua]